MPELRYATHYVNTATRRLVCGRRSTHGLAKNAVAVILHRHNPPSRISTPFHHPSPLSHLLVSTLRVTYFQLPKLRAGSARVQIRSSRYFATPLGYHHSTSHQPRGSTTISFRIPTAAHHSSLIHTSPPTHHGARTHSLWRLPPLCRCYPPARRFHLSSYHRRHLVLEHQQWEPKADSRSLWILQQCSCEWDAMC